jgi:hypothetical protein
MHNSMPGWRFEATIMRAEAPAGAAADRNGSARRCPALRRPEISGRASTPFIASDTAGRLARFSPCPQARRLAAPPKSLWPLVSRSLCHPCAFCAWKNSTTWGWCRCFHTCERIGVDAARGSVFGRTVLQRGSFISGRVHPTSRNATMAAAAADLATAAPATAWLRCPEIAGRANSRLS